MLFHWLRVEYKFKQTNKQMNKRTNKHQKFPKNLVYVSHAYCILLYFFFFLLEF